MAFVTVHLAPGLDARAARRARAAGPPAVATRRDHDQLLRSAGFAASEQVDLTEEFARVGREWLDLMDRHAEALRPIFQPGELETRQTNNRRQQHAVEAGLLVRSLFVART